MLFEESEHEHECESCKTVWRHGAESAGNAEAHSCPNCGQMQWWKRLPQNLSESCRAFAGAVRILLGA
jgi:predicted RNA-binding Zn-ribbon protein involved in translation (DUF1610 family)